MPALHHMRRYVSLSYTSRGRCPLGSPHSYHQTGGLRHTLMRSQSDLNKPPVPMTSTLHPSIIAPRTKAALPKEAIRRKAASQSALQREKAAQSRSSTVRPVISWSTAEHYDLEAIRHLLDLNGLTNSLVPDTTGIIHLPAWSSSDSRPRGDVRVIWGMIYFISSNNTAMMAEDSYRSSSSDQGVSSPGDYRNQKEGSSSNASSGKAASGHLRSISLLHSQFGLGSSIDINRHRMVSRSSPTMSLKRKLLTIWLIHQSR